MPQRKMGMRERGGGERERMGFILQNLAVIPTKGRHQLHVVMGHGGLLNGLAATKEAALPLLSGNAPLLAGSGSPSRTDGGQRKNSPVPEPIVGISEGNSRTGMGLSRMEHFFLLLLILFYFGCQLSYTEAFKADDLFEVSQLENKKHRKADRQARQSNFGERENPFPSPKKLSPLQRHGNHHGTPICHDFLSMREIRLHYFLISAL
ncbi:hypothetical protein NPIL_252441 [Nephila pilipes]|uniref:Uncharacterized protein n=1 Tax=Nephila pilipes TaxID=299642 RepID=A0A8X6P235_NEPPI|nr:hypothetical protein NPIL_252441 [Nephila pilipes]